MCNKMIGKLLHPIGLLILIIGLLDLYFFHKIEIRIHMLFILLSIFLLIIGKLFNDPEVKDLN